MYTLIQYIINKDSNQFNKSCYTTLPNVQRLCYAYPLTRLNKGVCRRSPAPTAHLCSWIIRPLTVLIPHLNQCISFSPHPHVWLQPGSLEVSVVSQDIGFILYYHLLCYVYLVISHFQWPLLTLFCLCGYNCMSACQDCVRMGLFCWHEVPVALFHYLYYCYSCRWFVAGSCVVSDEYRWLVISLTCWHWTLVQFPQLPGPIPFMPGPVASLSALAPRSGLCILHSKRIAEWISDWVRAGVSSASAVSHQ